MVVTDKSFIRCTVLNVEFQCSNNYLTVEQLCIAKQYDIKNDCTENLCTIQSYY